MEPTSESRIARAPVDARDRAHARRVLLVRRKALDESERDRRSREIGARLTDWLLAQLPRPACVGFYWPMQGEPDLRGAMRACHEAGVACALPVVVARDQPLVFRAWTPEQPLVAGPHGTLHPESPDCRPDLLVAPCVGFDARGFRLGYGGGYYDRTLSADARQRAIGVAFDEDEIRHLQPHAGERALEAIFTEARLLRPSGSA